MLIYEGQEPGNEENIITKSYFYCEENQMKDFDMSHLQSRFTQNSVQSNNLPEEHYCCCYSYYYCFCCVNQPNFKVNCAGLSGLGPETRTNFQLRLSRLSYLRKEAESSIRNVILNRRKCE
jgi:hypothetical protein